MVQRYEQTRKLQWYKRGAAYRNTRKVRVKKCMFVRKVRVKKCREPFEVRVKKCIFATDRAV